MPNISDDESGDWSVYSPFISSLEGKDDTAQKQFIEHYIQQSQEVQRFLTSLETATTLRELVDSGTLPPQYAIAIAKIVALAAMGEIPITGIEGLLLKLNLTQQQSSDITEKLNALLEPVIKERANIAVPAMPELPPMTQKIPPVMPTPDSSKTAGRNIIDLRKQQGGQ